MISRWHQKHRIGTGHHDRVQDRDVAVAIHHHHVAWCHVGVPDHLVGGGGAIGDKVAMVGVKYSRGVALGRRHRPGVIKQLA